MSKPPSPRLQVMVKNTFLEVVSDEADLEGYPGRTAGAMKDMWQNMKTRSQTTGTRSQPDLHIFWSDSGSSMTSHSELSSASALSSDLTPGKRDALRASLMSSKKDAGKFASNSSSEPEPSTSSTERSIWAGLRQGSCPQRTENFGDPKDSGNEERALESSQSSASPADSLDVEAKSSTTKKQKKTRKHESRQRPPKAQRMLAKKLALMLFEAGTDEDRELAEVAFMDATDDDPVVYDYAMSVLQSLRSTWRSNLVDS